MLGERQKGRHRANDPQMIATTEHSISMSLPNIWQHDPERWYGEGGGRGVHVWERM